jgi:hypothetical protein
MVVVAQFPNGFLDAIDWVKDPQQTPPTPPKPARDTRTLHFSLLNANDPSLPPERRPHYQGLLFFRKGSSPLNPLTNFQDGLDGTGHSTQPASLEEKWARVRVRFRPPSAAGSGRIEVVVFLLRADGDDFLPGSEVRAVEFDAVQISGDGRDIDMDPGTSNRWHLSLSKTTVLL